MDDALPCSGVGRNPREFYGNWLVQLFLPLREKRNKCCMRSLNWLAQLKATKRLSNNTRIVISLAVLVSFSLLISA